MIVRGRFWLIAVPVLALPACHKAAVPPPAAPSVVIEAPPEEDQWTDVASTDHVLRITGIDTSWNDALAAARKAGFSRQIAAEADLLDPAAALPRPAPTPGFYRCRILRFGAPGKKQPAFAAYREYFCFVGVNDDHLALTKDGGSERPGGYLWDDRGSDKRLVFLGAVALGTEKAPRAYADDVSRDLVGVFERIGDFRFRLVMPAPRPDSRLDVMELRAAPPE